MDLSDDITRIPLAEGERVISRYPLIELRRPFSLLLFLLLFILLIIPAIVYLIYLRRSYVKAAFLATNFRVVLIEVSSRFFSQECALYSVANGKLSLVQISYASEFERVLFFWKRYYSNMTVRMDTRNRIVLEKSYPGISNNSETIDRDRENCRRASQQMGGKSLQSGGAAGT